jgi:hypothetical protein
MTVTDAVDLTEEGAVGHGYACLLRGPHWAEEIVQAGNRGARSCATDGGWQWRTTARDMGLRWDKRPR